MLRVGLTGGIGSGKSTVAGRLAEHGATVIDADRLAREVVEPGTDGLRRVTDEFGPEVLTGAGALDRAALAARVFGPDAAAGARERLNAIMHPLIAARTAELIAAAASDAVVVHDVPLLVENGLAPGYHLVLVVDADPEVRVRRLVEQRGLTEADARGRIAAQATEAQRRAVADVWLDNNAASDVLLAEVDALWADRLVPFEANVRRRRMPERGSPHLVAPDPSWPAQAQRLAARLRAACGAAALRIDHIGSTSVPGLAAKNVLDLQVTVASIAEADALADLLAQAGFPFVPGLPDGTPHGADLDPAHWVQRTHASADPRRWANVHLRVAGSPGWRYALLFPAWLRADDTALPEYEAMKRATAAEFAGDTIPHYAEAKDPWFAAAHDRMERWAETTNWQP
jgi:dephospho-CoA kinase